jgi:hypothetical protein
MKYHEKTFGYFNYLNNFLDSLPPSQEQEGAGKSRSKTPSSKKRVNKILRILHDYSIKKPQLSKKYSRLEDKHIEEYRDETAIRYLIASWVYSDDVYDTVNPYNTFENIGMTQDALHKIQKIIELYKNTCYTNSQLHNIILEYYFGNKYKPVADVRAQFLYNVNIVRRWEPYRDVLIYNAPFRCAKNMNEEFRNIIRNIPNDRHDPATHTLFYHSTNWKSAQSILINIDHTMGEDCLDFGTGPSFYVGLHFEDALDWGEREDERSSHEVATFIFSLPKNIDKVKLKFLNGDEWVNVIKKSRLCLKHDIERECINKENLNKIRKMKNCNELPEIRDFDFVLGAMVANIYADYKKTKPSMHKPPKKQLASKTKEGDQYLQERMIGCVFYQKFMGGPRLIQRRPPI